MKRKSWYPLENNKFVIELNVDSLEQLFDKRDPNPYRIKDLDDDVVEYIVSSATEIGHKKIGKLRIVTNDDIDKVVYKTINDAIKDYFLYREDITHKKIHATFSLGFKTLAIGLCFLSIFIFASMGIGKISKDTFWAPFFKEWLSLMGWVSMWKPINIFLYEWWPLVDNKKLYHKLSEVELELKYNSKGDDRSLEVKE